MSRIHVNRPQESARLVLRLLSSMGAATFEMETLCRLAGIQPTEEIPTAAVECRERPRLLLNPDFVEQYCQQDEHLFLLVMHELWHIILAHTRLYPRVTPAHNIAFDAIINATLSRQFPAPEYRGFFDAINPPDVFPGLLLRPPEGWPDNPQYPTDDNLPQGTSAILERLYPPENQSRGSDPLYEEILALLRSAGIDDRVQTIYVQPVLLGDHDSPEREAEAVADELLTEGIKGMVAKWPDGGGADDGLMGDWRSSLIPPAQAVNRVFARTLRRCLGPRPGPHKRRSKSPVPEITGAGVLLNPRDRLAPARQLLGAQGLLWNQDGMINARVPETPGKAHIYLDVSGSMMGLLPHLMGMALPYVRSGQAEVYQFSTYVRPMPIEELKTGRFNSGFGTNINCVLQHAIDAGPRLRSLLILTDGKVGFPNRDLVRQIRQRNVQIYAMLPAESASTQILQNIAAKVIVLPPLREGAH